MKIYKGNKSGICPVCQTASSSVLKYSTRKLYHYAIGELSYKLIPYRVLRCLNPECSRKTFTHYEEKDRIDLCGRSIYSKSTQQFAAQKMLKHSISYNSFKAQIEDDFQVKTAVSTLYTWAKKVKILESKSAPTDFKEITVLNTDEKHPFKKKKSANNKFLIMSAGKSQTERSATPLHLNTASSNDGMALKVHYNELITKGLQPQSIRLVVTDLLPAYGSVIAELFPNALHQFCVFHLMQLIHKIFKQALKTHRYDHFKEGSRKEAHKTALCMMRGHEKLNPEEREKVADFCEAHPNVMADYALKEEIRGLYAGSKNEIQARAWKDIIVENYETKISATMEKALKCLTDHFEKTISYLKVGILHAKTNNDAERIMRKIQYNQKVHCYFRKEESLLRHLKIRLGITQIAA